MSRIFKGSRFWFGVGLGIFLLGLGVAWAFCGGRHATVKHLYSSQSVQMAGLGFVGEPTVEGAAVPVLEVPVAAHYLTQGRKGHPLLVSVEAVPIQCDKASCRRFERTTKLMMPTSGRVISSIPLSISEISDVVKTGEENWFLGVSVCEDSENRGKCDGKPLVQALRMKGSYLTAADYRGSFQLDIVSP
jgi:hypothetical protein